MEFGIIEALLCSGNWEKTEALHSEELEWTNSGRLKFGRIGEGRFLEPQFFGKTGALKLGRMEMHFDNGSEVKVEHGTQQWPHQVAFCMCVQYSAKEDGGKPSHEY